MRIRLIFVDLRSCLVYGDETCMKVLHMALFQPSGILFLLMLQAIFPEDIIRSSCNIDDIHRCS